MAVSASGDGVCNVYSVRKGVFIRTLSATNQSISTISTITLSPEGYIVFPAISHNQVMDPTRIFENDSFFRASHIFIYFHQMVKLLQSIA